MRRAESVRSDDVVDRADLYRQFAPSLRPFDSASPDDPVPVEAETGIIQVLRLDAKVDRYLETGSFDMRGSPSVKSRRVAASCRPGAPPANPGCD